jgi:hypothetical protein
VLRSPELADATVPTKAHQQRGPHAEIARRRQAQRIRSDSGGPLQDAIASNLVKPDPTTRTHNRTRHDTDSCHTTVHCRPYRHVLPDQAECSQRDSNPRCRLESVSNNSRNSSRRQPLVLTGFRATNHATDLGPASHNVEPAPPPVGHGQALSLQRLRRRGPHRDRPAAPGL